MSRSCSVEQVEEGEKDGAKPNQPADDLPPDRATRGD
jgi:hypothetical protein